MAFSLGDGWERRVGEAAEVVVGVVEVVVEAVGGWRPEGDGAVVRWGCGGEKGVDSCAFGPLFHAKK